MKIAIKAHPNRGKEVISLLESLGGINVNNWSGDGVIDTYYIDKNNRIIYNPAPIGYKVYTLEEFEKEFPFKVGDLCIYSSDILGEDIIVKILGMIIKDNCIKYEVGHREITNKHSYIYRKRDTLRPYKEMKEERNITLTLEKAKEWYKKGEELKEVALQAYSEEELNKVALPKTWEEFCNHYPNINDEAYISFSSNTRLYRSDYKRHAIIDRNLCSSQKSAEAHLALIQLERLRDCYRGLFVTVIGMPVWCIIRQRGELVISQRTWGVNETFLSFQSLKVAKEYLDNFKPLIEKAGDLI